jgi:hypothetical protein
MVYYIDAKFTVPVVVKSTNDPPAWIVWLPGDNGCKKTQYPSDIAGLVCGFNPSALFSGNVTVNTGDCNMKMLSVKII